MNTSAQPLISIILPTFNVEPYIDQCLSSIETQTYPNLELIIVDDGSDDGTYEKCQAYATSHHYVKLLSTPNKGSGCATARNIGLKAVSGEYIGFIDGDDWLEPSIYAELMSALISNKERNVTIATSGFYVAIPSNLKSEIKDVYSNDETVLSSHNAVMHLIEDKTIQSYLWNKLFHRSLWEGIEFPLQRAYSDLATVYKLFLRAKNIVTVPSPLYYYRQWNGSISRTGSILSDFNLHDAYESQLQDISTVFVDLEASIRKRNLRLEVSTCFFHRKQSDDERTKYSKEISTVLTSLRENRAKLIDLKEYSSLSVGIRLRAFVLLAFPWFFKIK